MSDTPTPAVDLPEAADATIVAETAVAEPAVAEAEKQPAIPELSPAACAARLAELFPAVFSPGAPKPLKLRIQVDIQARSPGVFTKRMLSGFLQRHTTGTAYLKALINTPQRIDLDGAPAGDVTDEHREAATAELARRRALHDARRAAERDAQREAQRAAQRQAQSEAQEKARHEHAARQAAHQAAQAAQAVQHADEGARRERANLLHAFETSTLTRANFCVLKRVPEAELETALVQAREERKERAQQAPPQQRHEPRQDAQRAPNDRPNERPNDRPHGRPSHARPPRADAQRGPRPPQRPR